MKASAVIAEDEPLLAESLRNELHALWPELEVLAIAGNGEAAVNEALARRPDVVFLDIRMPGMSGLEAAEALAEDWPEGVPFPLLVFVTAYDQYALQAFERAAIDYVLKPVQPARLRATVQRLQTALAAKAGATPANELGDMVERLRGLLGANAGAGSSPEHAAASSEALRVIQVGVGNAIHMVPIDDVLYFEAADKYVRVITASREHLIRTSLRDLLPRLDASRFWRIHRGTVVRAEAIASAERDESGHVTLRLQGRPDKLVVSRLYAHRFKAM
jgi:DNA-binding LytR/AlgR family response regulator